MPIPDTAASEPSAWLESPQGRYLLEWEQQETDRRVADRFGYNALQLGWPSVDLLRANRMSCRMRCARGGAVQVVAEDHALPFASNSIDLVLLSHVLEFSAHPHQVLREVERVLVPEGSVLISAFNPLSLWGLRRLLSKKGGGYPWNGHYLSIMRIRDWLSLLDFEVDDSAFGAYVPAVRSAHWIERWRFLDRVGARWWPVLGASCLVHGIKRVSGTRMILPQWRRARPAAKRLSAATQRSRSAAGEHGRSSASKALEERSGRS